MKLSVVIPAYNEAGCIEPTLREVAEALDARSVDWEAIVVNDRSADETVRIVEALQEEWASIRLLHSPRPHGFGIAYSAHRN